MDLNKAKEQCRHFEMCSSPMCPLDMKELDTSVWFPDEDICIVNEPPHWVERQEKFRDRTKDKGTCYTFNMLKWKCMIKKNINGIDPEDTIPKLKKSEREWMKNHKLKKPLSVKERGERCRRLETARKVRNNMLNSTSKLQHVDAV